jgi:hypothetical protein
MDIFHSITMGGRRVLLGLLSLLSFSAQADLSCLSTAYQATVGFNAAGGVVVRKSMNASKTLGELLVFTEYHVLASPFNCPDVREGSSCDLRVILNPDASCAAPNLDAHFPAHIERISNEGGFDLAIVRIEKIDLAVWKKSFDCVKTLEVLKSELKPQTRVARIGYGVVSPQGGNQKAIEIGTFSGYANHPTGSPSQPHLIEPLTKAYSAMRIRPGDCGGPVVELNTCKLVALSQIGPVQNKSLDIPAPFFELLLNGQRVTASNAAKMFTHVEESTLLNQP